MSAFVVPLPRSGPAENGQKAAGLVKPSFGSKPPAWSRRTGSSPHIRRQAPVAPKRIVDHAAQASAPQPRGAGEAGQLERCDELLPAVGSRLEPAQHIFGPDDRQREAPQGAVEAAFLPAPARAGLWWGAPRRAAKTDTCKATLTDIVFNGTGWAVGFAFRRRRYETAPSRRPATDMSPPAAM